MKEGAAEFVSDEEAKKLKQFDSLKELLAAAKDTGIELGEDILEQVAGGMSDSERKALYKNIPCPGCGAFWPTVSIQGVGPSDSCELAKYFFCKKCRRIFQIPFPR